MSKKRARILIVNNDQKYSNFISDTFGNEIEITIAGSFDTAVNNIILNNDIAVIITGYDLNSQNGYKILEFATRKSPESLKIVIADEVKIADTLVAINKFQVFKFFQKNISKSDLNQAVREALVSYRIKSELVHINEKTIKGFLYIPINILHSLRHEVFDLAIKVAKFAKIQKGNLPIKDFWSFEVSCLMMFTGSLNYNFTNTLELYQTQNLVKTLKRSATLTDSIPLLNSVSRTLLELAELYEHKQKVFNLSRDSEVLKILIDYFALQKGDNFYQTIIKLYSVDLVKFITSLSNSFNHKNERVLSVYELDVGMVAAENYGFESDSIIIK